MLFGSAIFILISLSEAFNWNFDQSSNLYWTNGCDFPSENDLKNVQIEGSLCGSTCAKTAFCTHFVWTSYLGGTCWMKKNFVTKDNAFFIRDSNSICGLLSEIVKWNYDSSSKLNWALDCDWKENNLKNIKTRPDLCGPECAKTQDCTHFTWSDYSGGTCWMKSGFVEKKNVISKPNSKLVCGFIDSSKIIPDKIGSDGFFIISHMVNSPYAIDWAVSSGANGIEIDLSFDSDGSLKNFKHGLPCDCSCRFEIFISEHVCHIEKACTGSYNVNEMLSHISKKHSNLPLIYLDSKTNGLSIENQKKAAKNVIDLFILELFEKGFKGKLLIGSGKQKEYIAEAARYAVTKSFSSKIYFTLDDADPVIDTLEFLSNLNSPNIIYSKGISICVHKTFYTQISVAAKNRALGAISNVFTWTLDLESSFKKYFDSGARGIITNTVKKLSIWAKKNNINIATLNDNSLPPAKTKIIQDLNGNCDCNYRPGGCSISKASPQNTACKCIYKGAWTCGGNVVRCIDENALACKNPNTNVESCIQGGGDCGGYGTKGCDCNYHLGGCSISKASPQNTACKCIYKGAWTCGGNVVRCIDENALACKNPNTNVESCIQGGGDCGGYGTKGCDCNYHLGGCSISKASPQNTACKCIYKGAWTCGGNVVRCIDENAFACKNPNTNVESCIQGGGDCGGYGSKGCDCDYKRGGCVLSTPPPPNTACKCIYRGAWTCRGEIGHCGNSESFYCKHPDKSIKTCQIGGGDCGGY